MELWVELVYVLVFLHVLQDANVIVIATIIPSIVLERIVEIFMFDCLVEAGDTRYLLSPLNSLI